MELVSYVTIQARLFVCLQGPATGKFYVHFLFEVIPNSPSKFVVMHVTFCNMLVFVVTICLLLSNPLGEIAFFYSYSLYFQIQCLETNLHVQPIMPCIVTRDLIICIYTIIL